MRFTKTILVTGAEGFTGRNLCARLGQEPGWRIVPTARNDNAKSVGCDLTRQSAVRELMAGIRPDAVYHCAGSFSNRWETDIPNNLLATTNLLTAAGEAGFPVRVLLLGSAAEYGPRKTGPIAEDSTLEPASVYGSVKVMQTLAMKQFVEQGRVDVVMARPFNLFGEGISSSLFPGAVLEKARLVKRGLKDKVEVRSLNASRDYIPVDEAVRDYVRIMEFGASGEIYNVGSGRPTPLRSLLARLLEQEGLSLNDVIVAEDEAETPPPISYASLAKISSLPKQ